MAAFSTQAAVVLNINETEGGVQFSFDGSLDLSAAGDPVSISEKELTYLYGSQATLLLLHGPIKTFKYEGSTPEPFGTLRGLYLTGDATGDSFAIFANDRFAVTVDYESGTPFSGSLFDDDASFSSLGLIAGVYKSSIGGDTITLRIGQGEDEISAVPIPATLPLLLASLGGLAVFRRRRG